MRIEDIVKEEQNPKKAFKEEKFLGVIHNVHILDASSSMEGGKYTNALLGIQKEFEALKNKSDIKYTQTFIEFCSVGYHNEYKATTHYFLTPMNMVKFIVGSGAMGGTPLYRCIGDTLTKLLTSVKPEDKVLVKIFTDGDENTSTGKYNRTPEGIRILSSLIKEVQEKNFTVTFVGTQVDVDRVTRNLNIDASNTLVHNNTEESVAESFSRSIIATQVYSARAVKGLDVTNNFYKSLKNN